MAARHPNWVTLAPPNPNISPFIRATRWAALGVGVAYGAMRYSQIRRKHEKTRVREYEAAEIKKEKDAIDRSLRNRDEMMKLAKAINMTVTPEMRKQIGFEDN